MARNRPVSERRYQRCLLVLYLGLAASSYIQHVRAIVRHAQWILYCFVLLAKLMYGTVLTIHK